MNTSTRLIKLAGAAGHIEVAIDQPAGTPRGLALVAHPHPLYGGTLDNKVTQTLARVLVQLGYLAARPNFRGVGATEGEHDAGRGEIDHGRAELALNAADLGDFEWDIETDSMRLSLRVQQTLGWEVADRNGDQGRGLFALIDPDDLERVRETVLAGFSFGTYVLSHVAVRLIERGEPPRRMVLVGTAAGKWEVAPVPANTLVIHGELDDTIRLQAVLDWARLQDLPVVVIPGADHFFHRKLTHIKQLVLGAWLGERLDDAKA